MKKIVIAVVVLTLLTFGLFINALACPIHGTEFDIIDMYYTSYWAKNATYHYMQSEYDMMCTICGRITHSTSTPVLKLHRWNGNICQDCDYVK